MEDDKQRCRQKLGEQLFDRAYAFLVEQRSKEKCDESYLFAELKKMVGTNRRLLTDVYKLDGIIFRE